MSRVDSTLRPLRTSGDMTAGTSECSGFHPELLTEALSTVAILPDNPLGAPPN